MLYLASQSPRRKELLEMLGYTFQIMPIECEEVYPIDLPVEKIPAYLAELKAKACKTLPPQDILLTADTIVVHRGQVLGKPRSKLEAQLMLERLSGDVHQVYTSICVKTKGQLIPQTDMAKVEIEKLTTQEIEAYIERYNPLDKAGAYGIQEWIGMAKVRRIEGSFYTIMGLPTHLVYKIINSIIQ